MNIWIIIYYGYNSYIWYDDTVWLRKKTCWGFWSITSNICWRLYPQFLGDVQIGHLPTHVLLYEVDVYIAMERSTVLKQGKTHYEYMAISNSKLLNLQRVRVLSRRTPYHGGLFLAMAMGSHWTAACRWVSRWVIVPWLLVIPEPTIYSCYSLSIASGHYRISVKQQELYLYGLP